MDLSRAALQQQFFWGGVGRKPDNAVNGLTRKGECFARRLCASVKPVRRRRSSTATKLWLLCVGVRMHQHSCSICAHCAKENNRSYALHVCALPHADYCRPTQIELLGWLIEVHMKYRHCLQIMCSQSQCARCIRACVDGTRLMMVR